MLRIGTTESGEYIADMGNGEFEINQDNYTGLFYGQADSKMYNRIAVKDPADIIDGDEYWTFYWKIDQDPDTFEQLEEIAFEVGSVLMRQTADLETVELFDKHHAPTDDEWEELLNGN